MSWYKRVRAGGSAVRSPRGCGPPPFAERAFPAQRRGCGRAGGTGGASPAAPALSPPLAAGRARAGPCLLSPPLAAASAGGIAGGVSSAPSRRESRDAVRLYALHGPDMFQLLRGFLLPAAACDGNRDGESRYANLFRKLDLNEDGRVDIAELQTGLRAMGIPLGKEAEEVSAGPQPLPSPGQRGEAGPSAPPAALPGGRGAARPGLRRTREPRPAAGAAP